MLGIIRHAIRSFFLITVFCGIAYSQFLTPLMTRPFESVFDNFGVPQSFFSQTPATTYDVGGQGIAYNVPSPGCTGAGCSAAAAAYRSDAVNFKSSTFGSGIAFQLGFNLAPVSYNYTINISTPGPYSITLWVGSSSAGGSWNILIDHQTVGQVTTPNTGSYSTLVAATSPAFNATLGSHILTLAWASGDSQGSAGDLAAWRGAVIGTGGPVLTTATWQNDTGVTLPAGTPITGAQVFRYGDIMPGNYPLIVDPANNNQPLAGQQWNEISTWRENGGNGSWRHAEWAIWLPRSLNNGDTIQLGFMATAGTYSATSHQGLSVLCGTPGPTSAAHHLKIHFTDVRNQNDTVRDSGDATFDVCNNINNTGRDAPRHVRAGKIYDEYIVSGMPLYASSTHYDPLLYVQAIIDIFTNASDGVSAGDVRWVFHVHNSWENVAAGSAGNAGNPGPAGFANDPQFISYRVEVDDGSTNVLDWSGLDATLASGNNPVVNAASVGANLQGETSVLNIPSSSGANSCYLGQAVRVSSTGTPVGGLVNNQLYWIWPSGSAASSGANTQYCSPQLTPYVDSGVPWPLTSSQGSGTTTLSTRITHYHFAAWQTLDSTGLLNWSPFGTTTRVTRKVYPVLTSAERKYWKQSGVVVPLYESFTPTAGRTNWGHGQGINYEPFGAMNVTGSTVGGTLPDRGIVSDFAAQAFITQSQTNWDTARLFTYGSSIHGFSTILDESTGRISAMNNGPPTGPGGNGNGGTYAELGPLRNQIYWGTPMSAGTITGLAVPLDLVPTYCQPLIGQNCHYSGGGQPSNGSSVGYGTYLSHMPSFDGFSYIVFGERQFLDMLQWHANRDFAQQRPGPGPELGQGYYRDNNAIGPDAQQHHYWGLLTICCDGRGSAWMMRDVLYGAVFGQDSNVTYPDGTHNSERAYFNDLMTETGNYWPLFLKYRDGPGSTGYSASIYPSNEPDSYAAGINLTTFIAAYMFSVQYICTTWLHLPVCDTWNSKSQRYWEGVAGGQLPGANFPAAYVIDEDVSPAIADGGGHQPGFGGNVGQYFNGTDASDWGNYSEFLGYTPSGQIFFNGYPKLSSGDQLKEIYNGWYGATDAPIDQLPGNRWFTIINVDNSGTVIPGYQHVGYIQCTSADHVAWPTQCPAAGGPFTGFSQGGVAITSNLYPYFPKLRFFYDPGQNSGGVNNNEGYAWGQIVNGLTILGYATSHATTNMLFYCGTPNGPICNNTNLPSYWWDPTIVVPGLPAAVNTVQ